MRHWGFQGVRTTAAGSDAGIDVVAADAVGQVKFEARLVGRPQLQNLVGARGRAHRTRLLFFTGAGYSQPAQEYALDMDIALFEYALDGTMTAVNAPARTVAAAGDASRTGSSGSVRSRPVAPSRPVVPKPGGARWLLAGMAALFWWGLISGLFRAENFQSMEGLYGGLALTVLAVGFTWLARRSFKRRREAVEQQTRYRFRPAR